MITRELFIPRNDTDHTGLAGLDGLAVLSDTVIMAGNHLGSAVFRDDMLHGDAGRKAEGLAQRTGLPVLAFDRLGTGPDAEKISVGPDNDIELAKRTGDYLAKWVETYGFKHVVLAGNSAAGSMAVSLARSETLPVSHLSVMDPVGTIDVSFGHGFARWVRHSIRESRLETPARPFDDREQDATGFVLREFLRDARAYHRLWESDVAANDLRHIASKLGSIATLVTWPEHTFTADPGRIKVLATELPAMRQKSFPDGKPFTADVMDGASNAWFENFRVYADCVTRVIDPEFVGYDY